MTDESMETQPGIPETPIPTVDQTTDEEPPTAATAGEGPAAGGAWKEVGSQFQALGAGLASAFGTVWKSEENKKHLREMRSGLEAMVNELGAAIKESTASPQAQQVKTEAGKTLETVKTAGEKTVQEIRPKLVAALATTNEELQKLLARMRKEDSAGAGAEQTDTPPPEGTATSAAPPEE